MGMKHGSSNLPYNSLKITLNTHDHTILHLIHQTIFNFSESTNFCTKTFHHFYKQYENKQTMASLGHTEIDGRKFLIYSLNTAEKPSIKRAKCRCISCRSKSAGFRFNTTCNIVDEELSEPYSAQPYHICKVSNKVESFWANLRCIVEHKDWKCDCYHCRKQAEEKDDKPKVKTVPASDEEDEELLISFKSFSVKVSTNKK